MRSDLLHGQIPSGARVTEHWAAGHYEASRTPVREACRRLAEEGLLDHRPRFGYRVPTLDRGEITELYEVRRALEGLSVERAGSVRGARPQIEALRRVWTEAAPDPGEEMLYPDEA